MKFSTPILQAPICGATTIKLVSAIASYSALGMLTLVKYSIEKYETLINKNSEINRLNHRRKFNICMGLTWKIGDECLKRH